MERVNVLILESIFHLGGAERVTYEIVKRMNREKYTVTLCTLYHPGPMGEAFIRDGYNFYHSLIKNRFDPTAFFKLRRIIIHNKIDLIYLINQPLTLFWGFVMGKACGVPIVSVIHNTVVIGERLKLYIYRLMLPFVNRIVTVAEMQKDHLVRNERIPEHLISVVYNGIDVAGYDNPIDRMEKIKSLAVDPGKKVVGMVTRFVRLKGIDVFLQAASLLLERKPGLEFILVGGGPEMEEMKSLAIGLKIEKSVHFLGVRNDIGDLLSLFDVAVLSSRTEALPMVLLEYMASGKPIVATRVGSVPELISHGETGLMVEPENPKAMADAISLLLDNEERARMMGDYARGEVKRRFVIENTVRDTEAVIDELVSGHRRIATEGL